MLAGIKTKHNKIGDEIKITGLNFIDLISSISIF
jgi:hypothetical protein